MNKPLLSVSIALPILLIQAGQSVARSRVIAEPFSIASSNPRMAQVTLDNQQPPPFILGARDDQEQLEACRWVGSCDGNESAVSSVSNVS